MTKKLRILLLEDNASDAELIERQLKKAGIGFVCELVKTRTAFLQALKTFRPDLILADYNLPKFDALQALALRKKNAPLTTFIIVTGSISEEVAVECMKQGADDYLLKDRLARLGKAVRHSLTNRRLQAEKMAAEESLRVSELLHHTFIDSSTDMAFLKDDRFKYLLANQALCSFYGKAENEIIGKTDFELLGKSAAAKCRKSDKQALAENRINVCEEKISGLTFETRKFPVKLIGGRIGVGGYIRDISERKQAESQREAALEALHEMNEIFRLFLKHSPIYVFIKDENIRPIYLSENYEKMLGRPLGEILGKNMDDLFPSELSRTMIEDDKRLLREGKSFEFIEELNGRIYSTIKFPIIIMGKAKYLAGFTIDITERKQAEEQVQASLREKEVLLKEIHHRVKNNLQIVSGLLTLQAAQINDERLHRLIKESQSRIWTMTLIHQTLYQSDNLADIDMTDYICSLVGNLLSSHAQVAMPPTVSFDLVPVRLVIDKAIPLALIINELVTNALKHAFPDGRPGEIRIALNECRDKACPRMGTRLVPTDNMGTARCAPTYELTVADNGAGLPAGFDPKNQKSLGLQLVDMLTKQLGGSLAFESSGGASVHIIFSNNEKNEK